MDDNWDEGEYSAPSPMIACAASDQLRSTGRGRGFMSLTNGHTSNGFGQREGRGDFSRNGGGSSGGGGRVGDWSCSCGQSNFSSRSKCFKCGEANPNGGGGGRDGDWTCSCGQSNFASRSKCFKCGEANPNGGGGGRDGDWTCSCGQSNFASRFKCFKCGEANPNGGGGGGKGGRPGDWTCKCGQSNFASRSECFKCSEPNENPTTPAPRIGPDGEVIPAAMTYVPPPPTEDEDEIYGTGISSGINFDKYDDIPVKVSGDKVPQPIRSFAESNLRKFLLEIVDKCGYKKPTPVQKHAIPIIMEGRDVMACAQTGSGKTAAFLLPMVNQLLADGESAVSDGESAEPQVVILSPTRELAIQIHEEARKFIRGSCLKACIVYGGTQVGSQIRPLKNGTHILVGTPGRLLDFVDKGVLRFSSLRYLVLDEADRMLDMGFKPAIDKMMNHSTMVGKGERQTLMFSATFPSEIQKMARDYLNNYLFITVGMVGGACADVEQRFMEVPRSDKKKVLLDLLAEIGSDRTVVFVETKKQADFVSVLLSERNMPATSIHGDREQRQREQAIRDFKAGTMHILVATAVASRGLDIKGIKHVINYDLPKEVDEYVHRIGRTGRVGNRGIATSFYDPDNNKDLAPALVNILEKAQQEVPDYLRDAAYGGCAQGSSTPYGGEDTRLDNGGNAGVVAEEW